MHSLKFTALSAALCLVASCSGVQTEVPEISSADKQKALVEIETYSPGQATNAMSEENAEQRLADVYATVKPAAIDVCRNVGENTACAWSIHYSDLREYNAMAVGGNKIVVFHEIIAATDNEDELAFVLAHELGHHIADHIDESRRNMSIGMLIAGLAMAAAGSGSGGCTTYSCLNNLQTASQASMQLGGHIGQRVFSVKQEKEADYLAAHIVDLAGYDLEKSRVMLVKLGTKSTGTENGFLKSHPSGPERLASFNKTIEAIELGSDAFPGEERSVDGDENLVANPAADDLDTGKTDSGENEIDPKKCRIYLPADKICIH